MSRRRICVVSGSRADYGLLAPVMRLIRDEPGLDLQLDVTGMHLSTEYGFTYRRLEHDGFKIDGRVDSLQPVSEAFEQFLNVRLDPVQPHALADFKSEVIAHAIAQGFALELSLGLGLLGRCFRILPAVRARHDATSDDET